LNNTLETLKQLDRRDWWLWWTAFAVMVLLLAAAAAIVFPLTFHGEYRPIYATLVPHIRLLAFAVMLFCLYAIYQQTLIKRLRGQLIAQIETNITLEVRAEELKTQAIMDPLTGAHNRRMIEDRLKGEISRSERHGYALTVLAFDLNDFKQINDTHGHAAGDAVLKRFTERLKKAIRASDTAGRLGGDEFLVILPECHSGEAERVVNRLGNLQAELHGKKISFAFSAGWAEYQMGESSGQLLERADAALYADKRARKGLVTSSPS
jgi:diguanylate cyclase (GGDEF)-like protein